MTWHHLLDAFVLDKRAENRMSERSEEAYRHVITRFFTEQPTTPEQATKQHVRAFLAHYPQPATRAQRHAILKSFFEWMVYEDLRDVNPAAQVKPTRIRHREVIRLTRTEILRLLDAAQPVRRDRWAVGLMLYGGLRNSELRGLRGRDLAREGWVHVVAGKGKKDRWVPVTSELAPVVAEIVTLTKPDHFVLPGRRWADPAKGVQVERGEVMLSSSALQRQMTRIAERAGLTSHVHPHVLRHAFAEQTVRLAGVKLAAQLLGHSDVGTTVNTYTGAASLDELAVAMTGFSYRGLPVAQPKEG